MPSLNNTAHENYSHNFFTCTYDRYMYTDRRLTLTDILFSVLKGRWEGATKPGQLKSADAIIRDRMVTGGAAGETTGAFVINNACTLVWSNERSWVRPKTVKCTVEAYAVM